MSFPFMPIYWGDYFRGTQQFTNATEHGAYMLLIAYCWNNGKLPSNDDARRRIAKCTPRQWSLIRDIVSSKFDDEGRNERCDKELAQALERSRSASAKAKLRHSHSNAGGMQTTTTTTTTKKGKKDIGKSLTLLPDYWSISADHYDLGKKLGLSTDAVSDAAEEMRAWSLGNGEKRRDWDHVFNNWLRRNAKNGQRRSGTLHDDSRSLTKAADKLIEQAKRGEFSFGPRPGLPPESSANIVQLLPKGRGDGA